MGSIKAGQGLADGTRRSRFLTPARRPDTPPAQAKAEAGGMTHKEETRMADTASLIEAMRERADALSGLGHRERFDLTDLKEAILLDATGPKRTFPPATRRRKRCSSFPPTR